MFRDTAQHRKIVHKIIHQVETIGPRMQESIVPVWRGTSLNDRALVGTAFFAEWNEQIFLITALHNFKENPTFVLKINLDSKIYELNTMTAWTSPDDDLWIAEMVKGALPNPDVVRPMPLLKRADPKQTRFGTGSVLIGYPETLNMQGKPFTPLSISTTLETRPLTSTTTLPEALVYNVDDDYLGNAQGEPVMPRPPIRGMSGGPVYSWFCTRDRNSGQIIVRFFLQGIIVSWRKVTGYVVACNSAQIVKLITHHMSER